MKTNSVVQANTIQTRTAQIYFCENPADLLLTNRKEISREKLSAIRELQRIETRNNVRLFYFITISGIAAFTVMHFDLLVVKLFSYLLMGFVIMGLAVLMHEASHNLMFRSASLNRWIGFLCGLPALISISSYRSVHLLHHAYARTERDPDDIEAPARRSIPMVLVYYVYFLIGTYMFIPHIAVAGWERANRRMRMRIFTEYGLIVGFIAFAFVVFPTKTVLNLWVYPLIVAAQLVNLRGVAEHGLTTSGNPFTATRTVLSNKFVSFFMCNGNYHLEHHLFPGVPWYNLPRVHHLLEDEYRQAGSSVYRSYTEFLMDFFKASWSGITPNVRLIPKHMREEICL